MREKTNYKKSQVQFFFKKTTYQTHKPGQLGLPWQTSKSR
jgi:hypothetical protein